MSPSPLFLRHCASTSTHTHTHQHSNHYQLTISMKGSIFTTILLVPSQEPQLIRDFSPRSYNSCLPEPGAVKVSQVSHDEKGVVQWQNLHLVVHPKHVSEIISVYSSIRFIRSFRFISLRSLNVVDSKR